MLSLPCRRTALVHVFCVVIAGCAGEPVATDSAAGKDDTVDTTTTDTDTDTDTDTATATVTDVTWSLDDDIGSIGIVAWEQTGAAASAWVEFQVDGGDWQSSKAVPGTVGPQQAHVLGVAYGTMVSFRVVGDGIVVSDTYTGETGPLPEGLVEPSATTSLPDELDPALTWLMLGVSGADDQSWKIIVDRAGRIVWAHPGTGGTGSTHVSRDGTHLLWDEEGGTVHRMFLDGTITDTVELEGLHHSFTEAADRTLVWGGKEGTRDAVWERTDDGTVRRVFDCATFWEDHDAGSVCDGNTLYWHEDDDSLLFSSDNESTVVHLDRATGSVLAYWGQLSGAWGFAPGSTGFWKNHSPLWTEEGHLMLSTWVSSTTHAVVAREYSLDEEKQRLTEVWTCDADAGIIADYSGETRRLDGGNTLLNYGPGAIIREYTPTCDLAWELVWPEGTSVRRLNVLDDLYPLMP